MISVALERRCCVRTLVDIPEPIVTALDELCAREHLSRAEVVRRAVSRYLDEQKSDFVQNAFGLWKSASVAAEDGLSYQRKMRDEW
jgi:Arc/MetJ-type ribon-helix-helix transcriptional regulator